MILSFTVPEGPDRKAYTILRRELNASAAFVRRLKVNNALFVNGEPAHTDRMLRPGDTLQADIDACEPVCDIIPEPGPVDVLYEEEGFLIVNKPCGMLIHPTHSRNGGTLANYAAGYLLANTGHGTVHAVNRLDRDTSGAVLLAKNSYMKALLIDALADSSAGKEYLAVVCGTMPAADGTIRAPIRRESPEDMRRIIAEDGQPSVTHYRVLADACIQGHSLQLLSLRLETGRTHQIRVHCAYAGCPLLGDRLYGTEASFAAGEALGIHSQLLHAAHLRFLHPLSETPVEIDAPVEREDIKKILKFFDF